MHELSSDASTVNSSHFCCFQRRVLLTNVSNPLPQRAFRDNLEGHEGLSLLNCEHTVHIVLQPRSSMIFRCISPRFRPKTIYISKLGSCIYFLMCIDSGSQPL